jgi:hypothetical protein
MQYGTVKVPQSVLFQHSKFIFNYCVWNQIVSNHQATRLNEYIKTTAKKTKKLSMILVPVDQKFMYIMMCLK